MSFRRVTTLLLILLACFCSKPEKKPPPKGSVAATFNAPPPDDTEERSNLLNMTGGSAVVSRTGEINLAFSAAALIDGDPASSWVTPPDDPQQSAVLSLPAPATIEKLGIQTTALKRQAARTVVIDLSGDGKNFTSAGSIVSKLTNDIQWLTISPQPAAFIRVTTRDSNSRFVQLNSVLVKGKLLEDVKPRTISGCWTINGRKARFEQRGARVTGMIEDREPYFLEGGSEGRLIRLNWIKGPQFGSAAITLTPDSQTLSGLKWHEVPVSEFFGEAWFGERTPCAGSTLRDNDVLRRMLKKPGVLPLYGLRFDEKGNLDVAASDSALRHLIPLLSEPMKLVARDFRGKTEADGLATSKAEIDSLEAELEKRRVDLKNITFEAAGTKTKRVKPVIQITRELYSAVELER